MEWVLAIYVSGLLAMFAFQAYLTPKYMQAMRDYGLTPRAIWLANIMTALVWPISGVNIIREWWRTRG